MAGVEVECWHSLVVARRSYPGIYKGAGRRGEGKKGCCPSHHGGDTQGQKEKQEGRRAYRPVVAG